jgi:hypothetical protein
VIPFTDDEVDSVIKSLKSNKSSGPEERRLHEKNAGTPSSMISIISAQGF